MTPPIATSAMITQTSIGELTEEEQLKWLGDVVQCIKTYDVDTSISENFTNYTVTSVCEEHLKARLARQQRIGAASLSSMSVGQIIELVKASDCIEDEVRTLASNLHSTTILDLLKDPRMPYAVLLAFLKYPTDSASEGLKEARTAVCIDEAILANERYLRSSSPSTQSEGLVRLDDLKTSFYHDSCITKGSCGVGDFLEIIRTGPPKGGLRLLDKNRRNKLHVRSSITGFISAFNIITNSILDGLNWDNVLVVGDIVLTALLHGTPSETHDQAGKDWGIDIYIYGLGPIEANEKVKELYEVWKRNLSATDTDTVVVKNPKATVFLPEYPHRRIQIISKLMTSPFEVISRINCDECALGFDGKDVLILPRCARALETGYSTFQVKSLWDAFWRGDTSDSVGAIHQSRGFQYTARGSGLWMLPSTAKLLEKHYPLAYSFSPATSIGSQDTNYIRYDNEELLYRWDEDFAIHELIHWIDTMNNSLFNPLRSSICSMIGIPYQASGCMFQWHSPRASQSQSDCSSATRNSY